MKDENMCFFSISLKNGITITGESPNKVRDFLYDMHSAFFDNAETLQREGFKKLANIARTEMNIVNEAIETINNNYKQF